MPFCLEKTRITKPESLKSESVICSGMVSGVLESRDELAKADQENFATAEAQLEKHLRCSQRLWRCESRSGEQVGVERVRLDAGLERQEGVAGIGHLEDTAKAILG